MTDAYYHFIALEFTSDLSNLSTISKLMERLVLCGLRPHLLSSGNFNPLQSAYRTGHSTENALLCILDNIYKSIDNLQLTTVVCLDISAAFDTISHSTLLQRLYEDFGVAGMSLDWLRSYLTAATTSSLVVTVHLQSTAPPGSNKGQSEDRSCSLHTYHHSAESFPVMVSVIINMQMIHSCF